MRKIWILSALGVFISLGMNACSKEPEKPPASALELEKSASPQVQKALSDLKWLRSAMLRYRRDVGELPPRGDYCPACIGKGNGGDPRVGKYPRPHMARLEQVLMKKDGRGWKGPYIKKLISKDPWGMEYTYDDNDPVRANAGDTYLWSAGADEVYGNTDDVRILVLTKEGTETR